MFGLKCILYKYIYTYHLFSPAEAAAEVQGWGADEFVRLIFISFNGNSTWKIFFISQVFSDQRVFVIYIYIYFQSEDELDDDYEDPDNGGDGGGSDYESPMDDDNNDYEPPPSEPPEDMALKLGPPRPLGDGEYIGKTFNNIFNNTFNTGCNT